jgi:sugar O-acyltransferase (sialic acid O-acetyltransferase NeuD family)
MAKLLIIGAGGFGKEVAYYCKSLNTSFGTYEVAGFIDDDPKKKGLEVIYGLKVIASSDEVLQNKNFYRDYQFCLAFAEVEARLKMAQKMENEGFIFPNVIHSSVNIDSTVQLGRGNIFAHRAVTTCDIKIGSFNVVNGYSGFGHDVKVGDHNIFASGIAILGEVMIKDFNVFHTNTCVLPRITIGSRNTFNVGSVVMKNTGDGNKFWGSPARILNI